MKVVIVSCFDTYEHRIDLVKNYFKQKGASVSVIQSNFRHFQKVKRTEEKEGYIFVDTLPYYKNMSVDRMKSHYDFSKKAFEKIEEIKPDLLYVMIPANSLAKFAGEYKKKNKDVKLYFDLIDLWPETMPIGKVKKFPPFTMWKSLRDKNLKCADFIVTECDYYQEVLKNNLNRINTKTIYLARENKEFKSIPKLSTNEINLCYLGSINNIIDIESIKNIIQEINLLKPVTLHIIGDGENKDILINEVKSVGAKVEFHGKIYDSNKKQQIFDQCHFGINMMKSTVCVGLTMKSIDYFEAGLPILNNIKGDTKKIVDNSKIGFNVDYSENLNELAKKIVECKLESFLEMRQETRYIFEKLFIIEVFNEKLNEFVRG